MFYKTILASFILVFVSCKNTDLIKKNKIKEAEWLIGNWENTSIDGTLSENWKKLNDTTFHASSYFIKGKDTLRFETILLTLKGNDLTYFATVKGENDDKAVAFQSTAESDTELIFENEKHDYPQKIKYIKGENNTLTAEISGKLSNKPASEKFVMTKK